MHTHGSSRISQRGDGRALPAVAVLYIVRGRRVKQATAAAPSAPATSSAGLASLDMLPEVGDAVEVLAGGVVGGEGRGALVPGEVLEGTLIGLVQANHGRE